MIVFDLDDTLYSERDFVRSGFRAVALQFDAADQKQAFEQLVTLFDHGDADPLGAVLEQLNSRLEKEVLLQLYREHKPNIELAPSVQKLLSQLTLAGHRLGILTDGRSTTQRSKIHALGLQNWMSEIVVSEELGSGKPDLRNYRHFEQVFAAESYAYVGDNLAKDFVAPNQLGWLTVGLLDRGYNIHPQRLDETPPGYIPQYFIKTLA